MSDNTAAGVLQPAQLEQLKTLKEKIKDVQFAMLTTVCEGGALRSRPMATQEMEEPGVLWFFTGRHSGKVDEVHEDQHVNLSYADPGQSLYVSVSGTARLVDDPTKAKQLWSPAYKAWFPKGLEDPNLALLRVNVTAAEYWDSNGSTMVQLYGMVKAMLTGKPPKGKELGEHEKVRLE